LLKWFRNVDSQSLGKWLLHGFCGSVNLWHMVSLTPLLELREWERGVSNKISTDQLPAPQLHVPHMLHCEILTSISHAFFSQSGLYYIYIYVYNSCDYILYLSNRRRLLVTWFICDSIGNAFAMLSNGSAISIFQPLGCRCDGVCTRCRQLGCAEAMVQKCHPEQGRADLTSTTSLVITVAHLKF